MKWSIQLRLSLVRFRARIDYGHSRIQIWISTCPILANYVMLVRVEKQRQQSVI